jgi:hypothetical protein
MQIYITPLNRLIEQKMFAFEKINTIIIVKTVFYLTREEEKKNTRKNLFKTKNKSKRNMSR